MNRVMLLPLFVQSFASGHSDASPGTCMTDGHKCNASADDTGLWLMQRRSALLSSDRHRADSEMAVHGTSGRFNHQIEQDVQEVVAMYEHLGYPPDALVKELKHRLSNVSLSEVKGRWGLSKVPMATECVAANAAAASYRFGASAGMMGGPAAAQKLKGEGFQFVKGFKHENGNSGLFSDVDYVGWWKKGSICLFNFQGSDSVGDFLDDFDQAVVSEWGLEGLHHGLVAELQTLVNQIPFGEVRQQCQSLVSIGHSLGGGLAQLFALLLNRNDDPLDAGIKADAVYSFGAMPPGQENFADDHQEDGCFEGQLFYNARRDDAGQLGVDIVNNALIGGQVLEPIKALKVLLVSPEEHLSFECGHLIPNSFEDTGFDLHMIPKYQYNLGCIGYLEFMLDSVTGPLAQVAGMFTR